MPSGRYRITGSNGTEDFRSAPGPAGWRYVSTIQTSEPEPHTESIDVSVTSAGRPVRLRIDTGAHSVMLVARGDELAGVRDGDEVRWPFEPGTEIDYLSPCFNVATASRLEATTELDVIYLAPYTIEPVRVRQRYEPLGDEEVATPVGTFRAAAWRYTALDTGYTARLWIAGGTVVAYEGLYELVAYEPGATGPRPL